MKILKMDSRRLSATIGFSLLIGCVIAVITVIYNGSSARTSYRASVEESWRKREIKLKERQDITGSKLSPSTVITMPNNFPSSNKNVNINNNPPVITTDTIMNPPMPPPTTTPTKIKEQLASELQKMFQTPRDFHPGKVERGESHSTPTKGETETGTIPELSSHSESPLVPKEKVPMPTGPMAQPESKPGSSLSSSSFPQSLAPRLDSQDEIQIQKEDHQDFQNYDASPSSSYSIERESSERGKQGQVQDFQQNPQKIFDRSKGPILAQRPRPNNILLVQQNPAQVANFNFKNPHQNRSNEDQDGFIMGDDYSNNNEEQMPPTKTPYYSSYNNPYNPFGFAQRKEKATDRDALKTMGNLVQVVTDFYKRGTKGLDIQGFLKVINETVQKGATQGLLTQLNQLYERGPKNRGGGLLGRSTTSSENSMSSLLFMSFGIFLLNQIHNFVGKTPPDPVDPNDLDPGGRGGRSIFPSSQSVGGLTDLDFLFLPPPSQAISDKEGNESLKKFENESTDSNSINNMFRAALNLVNAYTKEEESKMLSCIWSKYCQDLDKTAALGGPSHQSSLYSIAARINSVGLRLIMGQIPTELTVDVVLRSLLGWDGLPCKKMFNDCQIVGGKLKPESDQETAENDGKSTIHNQTSVSSLV